MNIVTVIQARMGSTRLPGKVVLPLAGGPLLLRLLERVNASKLKGTVIVAATIDSEDDIITDICKIEDIPVYRGSINDLLERHYMAALPYKPDAVIKIPSDCPLIDPAVIDKVISYYIKNNFDYVSNLHPASYPDGNDVEIMSFEALSKAYRNADKQFEREHTTPYLWENPELFKIGNVAWRKKLNYSMTHRFTIDYPEDYLFIKSIYDELYLIKPLFILSDILELLNTRPELMMINNKYAGVNWYRYHLNELKTITPEQTKFIQQ